MSSSSRHTNMFSFDEENQFYSEYDRVYADIEPAGNTFSDELQPGLEQVDQEQVDQEQAKETQLKYLPSSTRGVCMENGEKCINCYYLFAPCFNCSDKFTEPNAEMTWDEYKELSKLVFNEVISMSYEKFCIESKQDRINYSIYQEENGLYIQKDPANELQEQEPPIYEYYGPGRCTGPYSENFSECFGPCCN